MEKSHYQKIIDEVSKKLAEEILSKEKTWLKGQQQ